MAQGPLVKCRRCGTEKPRTPQYWKPCKTCTDGMRLTCRTCLQSQRSDDYRTGDKERSRRYRLRNAAKINSRRAATRLIGGLLTPQEYDAIAAKQDHRCAICSQSAPIKPSPGHIRRRALWVDHNHETGRVRGLLCHHCNAGLGYFKDRPEQLRKAAHYLEIHHGH